MSWQVHWLEATADLSPWRETIAQEIEATRNHLAGFKPPPRLDILVQRIPGGVIPEIGIGGSRLACGSLALTVALLI